MSFSMYSRSAPPPPGEEDIRDWSTGLKHIVAQGLWGKDDGSLRAGPQLIEKDNVSFVQFLRGVQAAGPQELQIEAALLINDLLQSDYGLIIWIGERDET
jgi:hypothetical protein